MKITLKLFATLGDYLPEAARQKNELPLEVAPSTTVAEIISRFNLPEKLVHLVLVNGAYVAHDSRLAHELQEGDVLAIWPPIAGG